LAVNRDYSPNKPFHRLEGGMAKNHYSALQVDVVALAINRDYYPNKLFHRLEGGIAKCHYSALQVDVVALAINRNYSHRMEGDGRP